MRGGEHGNGASLFEDDVDDDVDDYGPDDDLSTLSFSKRWWSEFWNFALDQKLVLIIYTFLVMVLLLIHFFGVGYLDLFM